MLLDKAAGNKTDMKAQQTISASNSLDSSVYDRLAERGKVYALGRLSWEPPPDQVRLCYSTPLLIHCAIYLFVITATAHSSNFGKVQTSRERERVASGQLHVTARWQ